LLITTCKRRIHQQIQQAQFEYKQNKHLKQNANNLIKKCMKKSIEHNLIRKKTNQNKNDYIEQTSKLITKSCP